jgi:hypothetical protein
MDSGRRLATGATFWLGEKDVVACEQGRLNLDTGDDYDLDELKEKAWRIFVKRLFRENSYALVDRSNLWIAFLIFLSTTGMTRISFS